jgi:hypothetical protein
MAKLKPSATAPSVDKPAAPAFDLASLTAEQLAKLTKQLAEKRKADRGDHESWKTIVDTMLKEREGDGFKHTTSDILAAVQAKAIVPTTCDRPAQLKRIQTRKQQLERMRDDKGNLIWDGKVGYKQSANSFGPMDGAKVVAWLSVPANVELLTVAQADAITKAVAHMV